MKEGNRKLDQVLVRMNRTEKIKRIVATVILLVFVLVQFIRYNKKNYDNVLWQETKSIQDLTVENATFFQQHLEERSATLSGYGEHLASHDNENGESLKQLADACFMDECLVIYEGKVYGTETVSSSLANEAWVKRAYQGETGTALTEDDRLISYAPIYQDGVAVGVLCGYDHADTLAKQLTFTVGNDVSDSYLVDNEGTVLASNTEESATTLVEIFASKMSESDQAALQDAIDTRSEYAFSFTENEGEAGAYLYPIPETDMMLVHVFPARIVKIVADRFDQVSMRFGYGLAGAFVLYGIYMFLLELSVRRSLLADRNTYIEVIGGIAETFDYVGIFDLGKNTFTPISGELTSYGIQETDNADEVFTKAAKHLQHPDIADKTMEEYFNRDYLIQNLHQQGDSLYFEYYNANDNDKYKGVTIYCLESANNTPLRLLFAARDLSVHKVEEKKTKEKLKVKQKELEEMASHDPLTGALNRNGFRSLAAATSARREPIAFVLIDLDKFKTFNDTYGHEVGDQILVKLVNALRKQFRETDNVIRLGGDEFAMLLHDFKDNGDSVIHHIESINHDLMNPSDGLPAFSISAGFAIGKEGYSDLLYKQADEALYHTKENGRAGCTMYQE